jgi:hypothetical protein
VKALKRADNQTNQHSSAPSWERYNLIAQGYNSDAIGHPNLKGQYSLKTKWIDNHWPILLSLCFLLFIVLVELIAVLILNDGHFVYTLDDPYIHLSLAENIIKGHYGVNNPEFSSPSSSILWPLILAPFSSREYFPLIFNVIISIMTVFIFDKILHESLRINDEYSRNAVFSLFMVLLIMTTNMVGLIFIGMEHSLQVFIVSIISYGLILEQRKNKVESWLVAAIAVAPLVRYDTLAVSAAALFYLGMRGYLKIVTIAVALIAVSIGSFSFFLVSLGLDPIPSSIMAKSNIVLGEGLYHFLKGNIRDTYRYSFNNPHGLILSIGAFGLISYSLFVKVIQKRQLAIATLLTVPLHMVAGRYGWYNRYEIYIWSFLILISLFLIGPQISHIFTGGDRKRSLVKMIILSAGFWAVTTIQYTYDLFTLPVASNNMYEQQYQMHRFATHYYKKPVAVNDLGWVSYKNDNYVLDLYGLGSKKTLQYRKYRGDGGWMKALCRESNVEMAMIYENWFKDIPRDWIRVGYLRIGRNRVTSAGSDVAFYAINLKAYSEISEKLPAFIKTLPSGVRFIFQEG